MLCERGVAVWDVLRECYREGSLDTAIRVESESPNDFVDVLPQRIRTLARLLQRPEGGDGLSPARAAADRANWTAKFRYVRLPSTSPAHAGRSFEQKLAAWRAVRCASA